MPKVLSQHSSVGLVLSGGGAKGAYQVGVLRGLAELGVAVDAVSGASIGSLNAAMIACAPDLATAAQRMDETWRAMGHTDKPTKFNRNSNLKLAAGVAARLAASLACVYLPVARPVLGVLAAAGSAFNFEEEISLLSDEHVAALVRKYIDFKRLPDGKPLWVSL